MSTLAEVCGSRAIGVVLSGAGYDDTAALAAIREAGGITMAQTPESATLDSMPRSAKRLADYCWPPADACVQCLATTRELNRIAAQGRLAESQLKATLPSSSRLSPWVIGLILKGSL